jgi:hypothetical protein
MSTTLDRLFIHTRMHDASTAVRITVSALVKYADGTTGRCWPSTSRLMEDTGLSRRGLQEALRWLRERGLVRDTGETRGEGVPVRVVHWATLMAGYGPDDEEEGGAGDAPGGRTPCAGGAHLMRPEPSSEPSKEPNHAAHDSPRKKTAAEYADETSERGERIARLSEVLAAKSRTSRSCATGAAREIVDTATRVAGNANTDPDTLIDSCVAVATKLRDCPTKIGGWRSVIVTLINKAGENGHPPEVYTRKTGGWEKKRVSVPGW